MNKEILKTKVQDWTRQLLTILLYLAIILLLQGLFKNSLKSSSIVIQTLSRLSIELIVLTVFILLFGRILVPDYRDFANNGNKYIKECFKYWIYGLLFMAICNIIISSFQVVSTNQELNESYLFKLPLYSIIATIIFAPIIEETMTKLCLRNTFKNNIIYYLVCGFIFGAMHMLNATTKLELLYIIPYGSLGFTFAYMYKKTNNIWTSIFFHGLHNLMALSIIILWG
jgi:membrane protease YdiL (CAAX protease family)